MTRSVPRSRSTLPPITLTPEEAAAVAVALSGHPGGPYADARRGALEKVLTALEPDPARRAGLLAATTRAEGVRSPVRRVPTDRSIPSPQHPAGRALAGRPRPSHPGSRGPRLVLVHGGAPEQPR